MKALVKAEAKPGIWLKDLPTPKPKPHEVLIKVHKTAICGTDMHIYAWDQWAQDTITTPITIGHEFSGEIAEVGEAVDQWQVGQRVSAEGHIICGQCRQCRTGYAHVCPNTIGIGVKCAGAFAEYLTVPASNVIAIPSEIDDNTAAIFDPLGNAVHCAFMFDMAGESVFITGAGPVGLLTVAIAKYIGVQHIVVTDHNDYRLALAKKIGATHTVNAQTQQLTHIMPKASFQIGLEMSGAQAALQDLLTHIDYGGKIVLLGVAAAPMTLDLNQIVFKGLTLTGIYGRQMYQTWYKMLGLLQGGLDVSPVITHHFAADDYQKAFDIMASGQSGKVILDWS